MANIPILSFNAGELSPQIDARADIEKYSNGCRHLENMIPRIYGSVTRRPGTKYIYGYEKDTPTEGKIQIYTLAELALIGVDEDYPLDGNYELMNNIDASDTEDWEWEDAYGSTGWLPIGETGTGTPATPFSGTFDGRYHTIRNLYINHSNPFISAGLFGRISGGTIERLRLSNINYLVGKGTCGGLVGIVNPIVSEITIEKCVVNGTIKPSGTNTSYIGGFISILTLNASIADANIDQCYANVKITISAAAQTHFGGFAASLVMAFSGTGNAAVTNCYSTGNISGSAGELNTKMGGFVSDSGEYAKITIENCYSSGTVPVCSETYNRGGFLGYDAGNTVITSCYYDEDLSECEWSDGGTTKDSDEMKQEATFVDWDFDDIWEIEEDVSPPTLVICKSFWTPIDTIRLIPFIFSATIAYKIEIGDMYMRFIYDDDPLLDDNGRAEALETPYVEADIFELQYAQLGDTMWLVHKDYAPRKLVRTSATAFLLTEIEFTNGPFLIRNDIIDPDNATAATMKPSVTALDSTGTLTCTADIFDDDHVGALFKLVHPRANTVSQGSLSGTTTGIVCAAIDVEGTFNFTTGGNWAGTIVLQRNENGAGWENYRTYVSTMEAGVGSKNVQYTGTEHEANVQYRVNLTAHTSGKVTADITVNESMQSGIVRILSITSATVANIKVLKKLSSTDATRRWAEGAWSPLKGYPSTVTFFENRCIYGGMSEIPEQI